MTPQRIESTLLVVEDFKDASGYEWRAGDRASLARAAVRQAATERPALFVMEYASEPFDPKADWFTALTETYEARYDARKKAREAKAETSERALREEMKKQQRGQPELERRYREQEREKEKRLEQAREHREREGIERELELGLGPPGFHH
jgi:hypothetical protein